MKSLKSQFSIDEQSVLEYIFSRVLKAFPKAECTENEKKHIIEIGEKYKFLICYFSIKEELGIFVKFKFQNEISLSTDISIIDELLDETIKLFQSNNMYKREFRDYIKVLEDINTTNSHNSFLEYCPEYISNKLKQNNVLVLDDLKNLSIETVKEYLGPKISLLDFTKIIQLCVENSSKNDVSCFGVLSCKFLFVNSVLSYLDNSILINYLKTINYDEKNFESGSLGYCLCVYQKCLNLDINNLFKKKEEIFEQAIKTDVLTMCQDLNTILNKMIEKFLDNKQQQILRTVLVTPSSVDNAGNIENKVENLKDLAFSKLSRKKNFLCETYFSLLKYKLNNFNYIPMLILLANDKYSWEYVDKFILKFLLDKKLSKTNARKYIKQYKSYRNYLSKKQKYNEKFNNVIIFPSFKKKISQTDWDCLKIQRTVNYHGIGNAGVLKVGQNAIQYESEYEKYILEQLLKYKVFKDIKTQSLRIPYQAYYYTPDFECLTFENNLVIVEVKPINHMRNNISKFELLHNYCKENGYGYCIIDRSLHSYNNIINDFPGITMFASSWEYLMKLFSKY